MAPLAQILICMLDLFMKSRNQPPGSLLLFPDGTPMLLITGAKDIMVPFRILEKGYKNYGGEKEHFVLENSNHMMFVDEPGLFVSKVIEYFEN